MGGCVGVNECVYVHLPVVMTYKCNAVEVGDFLSEKWGPSLRVRISRCDEKSRRSKNRRLQPVQGGRGTRFISEQPSFVQPQLCCGNNTIPRFHTVLMNVKKKTRKRIWKNFILQATNWTKKNQIQLSSIYYGCTDTYTIAILIFDFWREIICLQNCDVIHDRHSISENHWNLRVLWTEW